MRAPLTKAIRRIPLAVLIVVAAAQAAAAEEPRYRILFPEHSAEPVTTGEAGAHNSAEVKRIAGAMRVLAPLGTVRFVFVAPRAATCVGTAGCAPEHLMWQRVNAATTALRSEAARASLALPFQLIGWSFLEELPARSMQISTGSGIDFRLHLEPPRSEPCQWRILVHDPALPPVIGAREGEPALPVPSGKTIEVSKGARVSITTSARNAGQPLAVWQNAQGEPRKVDPAAFAKSGASVPAGPTRLVLLDPASAEARAMLARIGGSTREFASSGNTRGFDDHVGPSPLAVLPPRADDASSRCEVRLAAQTSE